MTNDICEKNNIWTDGLCFVCVIILCAADKPYVLEVCRKLLDFVKTGSCSLARIMHSHSDMAYVGPSCLYRQLGCLNAFLDIKDTPSPSLHSPLLLLPRCLITITLSAVHSCHCSLFIELCWRKKDMP